MHISQDPIVGGGQLNLTFWDRVHTHYNDQWQAEGHTMERFSIFGEQMEQGKHDVAKFSGFCSCVVDTRHSGTNNEDTMQRAKELYQINHPKQKEF